MMTVTYTLTREDLLQYCRYCLAQAFKMPPGWAFTGGIVLFTLGLFVAGAISSEKVGTFPTYEFMAVSVSPWGATIAWTCSTPRLNVMVNRYAQTYPSLFVVTCVTVNSSWLAASSVYSDVKLRWQGVHQVASDERSLYMVVGERSLIIPKSSYDSPSEAEAFLNAATEYWRAAQQRPIEAESSVWPPAPRIGA